jgi:hypothetical protein
MDIQQKLAKFAQILGILNNNLQPNLVQKFSGMKVNNALVLPILLHGSKIWTLRKKDKNRMTSIEIKFFRSPAGYTKEIKKFLEEMKVEPVDEKLRRYKSNWL